MKTKNKKSKQSDEAATAQNKENAPAVKAVSDDNYKNELNARRWSVVSFEKREASNLTYDEASKKLKKLAKGGVSGLCVVTDEAAERI